MLSKSLRPAKPHARDRINMTPIILSIRMHALKARYWTNRLWLHWTIVPLNLELTEKFIFPHQHTIRFCIQNVKKTYSMPCDAGVNNMTLSWDVLVCHTFQSHWFNIQASSPKSFFFSLPSLTVVCPSSPFAFVRRWKCITSCYGWESKNVSCQDQFCSRNQSLVSRIK